MIYPPEVLTFAGTSRSFRCGLPQSPLQQQIQGCNTPDERQGGLVVNCRIRVAFQNLQSGMALSERGVISSFAELVLILGHHAYEATKG